MVLSVKLQESSFFLLERLLYIKVGTSPSYILLKYYTEMKPQWDNGGKQFDCRWVGSIKP